MEDIEIPGSYRWVFLGGPKNGEMTFNETGAPSSIEGDDHHAYQLQTSPEYMPDMTAAPDVTISVYVWIDLPEGADEAGGGGWN